MEDEQVAVSVRSPAEPTVKAVEAIKAVEATVNPRPNEPRRGASVTATVGNEYAFPAAANLTLAVNGEAVETRRVELAPNGERRIAHDEWLLEAGTHVFRVEHRTATVRIDPTLIRFSMRHPGIDRGTARGRTGKRSDETV